jgi:hypothetical protein
MDLLGPLAPIIIASSILWVGAGVGIGMLAERRGASGLSWFALAIFATPVLALILLMILTPRDGPTRHA